jgi:hypothetical protein
MGRHPHDHPHHLAPPGRWRHQPGYNRAGHALIEVVGHFEAVRPHRKQLDATAKLMAALARKYKVSIDTIHDHKDYSAQTVCPGEHLYACLQDGYFRRPVALLLAWNQ